MKLEKELSSNRQLITDFDGFIDQKLTVHSKVLDIGFGTGKLLYRLFHKHGIKALQGIDLAKKEEIEQSNFIYLQLIDNKTLITFIEEEFTKKEALDFYTFYQKYTELELDNPPLSKQDFETVYNIEFDKGFKRKDFESDTYDLIIASKVIHYEDIENPDLFLVECMQLLKNNGHIYLSFPTDSKRRKISKEAFIKTIEKIPELNTLSISEVEEATGTTLIFKGVKKHN